MPQEIKIVKGGRATAWLSDGYNVFKKYPWIFIGFTVIDTFLSFTGASIPKAGAILGGMISTLFFGGWLLCLNREKQGHKPKLEDIFLAFKTRLADALIFTILAYVFYILCLVPMIGLLVGGGIAAAAGLTVAQIMNSPTLLILSAVIVALVIVYIFIVVFVVSCVSFFGLPLVLLKKQTPVEAIKQSVIAGYKNIWPLSYLYILYFGLSVLAVFTLFIGFLVVIPIVRIASFECYCDVFKES